MPQFTPWTVQSPFPNVLYNPAAVDKSIAESQSLLGELDIHRQQLGIEQQKLDQQRAAGAALLGGGSGGTGPPADTTPFEQQMGSAEGGADPAAVNKQGYAGQFQFGAGRLADLGLYTPAPGEDLKSNQWKGQFHIAPYNVATLDDFLKSPAAQHAAFVAHVGDIDKTIDATPGADKFDRNGLRAVAHLGGTGGMQAFVASGGNLDRADANGTSLKNYYQRFAQGGAPLLQKTFGSVHGPGGPPSDLPAVQPGGRVGTAWVDPNAPTGAPLPTPPIPPEGGPPPVRLAGPRVTQPGAGVVDANGLAVPTPTLMPDPGPNAPAPPIAPVVTGDANTSPIVPQSTIALRTGGTDTAGPGAGQTTLPTVETPNRMYQTGLPGITIGGPGNPLAPPGAAPGAIAPPPSAPPGQAQSPPGAQRPPVPQLPPAPSRVIPTEPLIQSGPMAGLTAGQGRAAAAMVAGGTPVADVAARMEGWRQQNVTNRQTAATNAAAQQQADLARQQWVYEQQVKAGWEDAGNGVIRNRYTGETKYAGPPTPRIGKDESGRQFEVLPGGGMRYLTDNPSGVTGSGDDASALRIMNEVGPKIANGTATPQEQANYTSATEIYRKPTIVTDAVTKEQRRVYQRDLPQGFPAPPGLGGGAPGQPGASGGAGGSQVVVPGLSPAQQQIEQDPAAYKVAESQYTRDAGGVDELATAGRQAQADQVRIKEMQDVLQRFSTGPGTDWRTAATSFLQRWAPSAVSGWEKQSPNLSGNDAAQAFSKLALVGAGTQERGVLGARGGYQAIKLFKEANPNVDLNDATNKSILDMQLISNQANQDYTQSALSHFADNETKFAQTHKYDSLAQFDRNWNAQRNPQVYSGAMGAISGQPYQQWSKGLQEPEIQRALDIVSRANPSAVVNGQTGRLSMQPTGQTASTTPATPPPLTATGPGGSKLILRGNQWVPQ